MPLIQRRRPRFLALVVTILAFSGFLAVVAAQTRCKENEVYIFRGSACPPTCEKPKPDFCTRNFVSGCFCKDGLVRAKDGNCVPLKTCKTISKPIEFPDPDPSECKAYEIFSRCTAHCDLTCERLRLNPCSKVCIPGCICKPGLVRAKNGSCVPVQTCKVPTKPVQPPRPKPAKCKKNEVFDSCSAHCEPTCGNPRVRVCSRKCSSGCVCKRGLFRAENGKCVRKSSCKKSNTSSP